MLDEIGEMKPALQAKLLHVLQDGEFTKLGSNKRIEVDVRVVAATNRDLEKMMLSGDFREDLYYRLKVIELTVPPLRERRDEIPHADRLLRRALLAEVQPAHARPLSDELRQLFLQYDWPGNIRELENMIKRIVVLQDEQLVIQEIQPQHQKAVRPRSSAAAPAAAGGGRRGRRRCRSALAVRAAVPMPPLPYCSGPMPPPPPGTRMPRRGALAATEAARDAAEGGGSLAAVAKAAAMKAERAAIEHTLRQVHWNRRKAAQILGVSYKTLLNKIKESGISRA